MRGSFHHTPATVRAALAFLASGAYPWDRLVTHRVSLGRAARALRRSAARPAQGRRRPVTLRELNRTLLLRQLLLERKRVALVKTVTKLVALQAQYAPSPYVALWSRIDGFRKEQLTRALAAGSIVKAGSLRTTLHVMSAAEFPYLASAYVESERGRTEGLGVDVEVLRAALPDEPITSAELFELGHRVLGTDDRWTVAFAYRALPFVRTAPVGEWPHTKPSPFSLWREPLPDPRESAIRVVRQYLAAYGPATRDDIAQYTSFKVRQIVPALEGLPTGLGRRGTDALRRAARAARRRRHARTGALPAGVRLDHPRAPRPVADRSARVRRSRVQQAQCDDEEHVHGRRLRRRCLADRARSADDRAVRPVARARPARGGRRGRAAARLVPRRAAS